MIKDEKDMKELTKLYLGLLKNLTVKDIKNLFKEINKLKKKGDK